MLPSSIMQNELIVDMSSLVTESIKQEVENPYAIKVDGTKDLSKIENISIIVRIFNEPSSKVAKRILVLSSCDSDDAKSINDVILTEC